MKKLSYILVTFLFLTSALPCCAQEKRIIDLIQSWRQDTSCDSMELGKLIKTKKDAAVPILKECCKKHKSGCLSAYSSLSPSNIDPNPTRAKTLLYLAMEVKAYKVAEFLFTWAPENYQYHIDDYGITHDEEVDKSYFIRIEAKGDITSMTPLMLTCSRGDYQGTKLLIDNGASLEKSNYISRDNGNSYETYKTAYDYAEEYVKRTESGNSIFWNYISTIKDQQKNYFKYSADPE
jgi:Ankyrin repeat.